MKIVVVNGWHDDNKGDGGIVQATIDLLTKKEPEIEVALVSTFSEDDPALGTSCRHLCERYPGLVVLPSPLPTHQTNGILGYYGGVIPWVVKLVPDLVRLALGIEGGTKAARAIARANLVVSKGGQIFYNKSAHPRELAHLFKHLYPLLLARRAGVPYVVLGQSFGPFNGWLGSWMARRILGRASALLVRERLSYDVLARLGVDPKKVAVIPDLAFWLVPEHSARVRQIIARLGVGEKQFWAVTVRIWPVGTDAASQVRRRRYLDEMAKLISQVLQEGLTPSVVLVVHTKGPLEVEKDSIPTRELLDRLAHWRQRVFLIDEDLTPAELVALYSYADFMIGTRFHSVIFSLVAGTPAFALSYFGPKADGIMTQFGLKDLCVDVDRFTASDAVNRIRQLKNEVDLTKVREQVTESRKQLIEATELILSRSKRSTLNSAANV
jgi:polysaccharide pyruvyl transferase WcaK-like protein